MVNNYNYIINHEDRSFMTETEELIVNGINGYACLRAGIIAEKYLTELFRRNGKDARNGLLGTFLNPKTEKGDWTKRYFGEMFYTALCSLQAYRNANAHYNNPKATEQQANESLHTAMRLIAKVQNCAEAVNFKYVNFVDREAIHAQEVRMQNAKIQMLSDKLATGEAEHKATIARKNREIEEAKERAAKIEAKFFKTAAIKTEAVNLQHKIDSLVGEQKELRSAWTAKEKAYKSEISGIEKAKADAEKAFAKETERLNKTIESQQEKIRELEIKVNYLKNQLAIATRENDELKKTVENLQKQNKTIDYSTMTGTDGIATRIRNKGYAQRAN